ncbi:MAG: undecaprenyl-diphosphate phosphatase [Terrimicrobiaceae bacterium]
MLPAWLAVLVLGIVEGITEFIPVSSTGHLLIAEHWLGCHQTDLFNVVIQCGAVVAVLPLFKDRIAMLLRWREPASLALNGKILTAFLITVAGGLVIDKLGIELPETVQPVAAALIVGGILFILVEVLMAGKSDEAEISWAVVIAVAVAQLAAAVFPGASRSGATIIFAMMLGTGRVAATEFSFLVGIPTLLAAGGYKILKGLKSGAHEEWALLAMGTAVAAVVSFIAVKWLLRYVQTHTFVGFGIYRIVLGLVLLWVLMPH